MQQLNSALTQLRQWYQSPLGTALSDVIKLHLQHLLADRYGYHIVQYGLCDKTNWLASSNISHQICISPADFDRSVGLCAVPDQLPLANESVDIVVLPHVLSLSKTPQLILKEAERVLISQGYLLIIGFNPLSLWGARRLLRFKRNAMPWRARFMSQSKLHRLLKATGFELLECDDFFYRPPINHSRFLERSRFLETLGEMSWVYPGAVYVCLAQKQVSSLTPIKPIWSYKNFVLGKRQLPSSY